MTYEELIIKISVSEKIKTINNKSSKAKLNIIETDKLLRFELYPQKILLNINFRPLKIFYQKTTCHKKLIQLNNLNILLCKE